jgi:hypothetical protein
MVASPTQPLSRALEKVLARLKGVHASRRGWTACCPAHGDRVPSLTIGLGEHGQVLLKCFAGCSIACIVQAMVVNDPKSEQLFAQKSKLLPRRVSRDLPAPGETAQTLFY